MLKLPVSATETNTSTTNKEVDSLENTICLACGSTKLTASLDLGEQPLANSFKKTKNEHERKYKLAVNVCENCFHVQLTHSVNPKIIYENYLYVSGTTKTLKEYSNWFAGCVDEVIDRKTNNVFDIGCNDGTQLDSFKALGYNTYGIDPAKNLYEISSKKHTVMNDFFGPHSYDLIKGQFDAIIAQNVVAHNPNPLAFLQTCNRFMSDHTLLFVQTSQANMILNNEFDTIYHEHINFFNINSMNELAKRARLNLIEVFKTPIHGTSYVFVFSKTVQHPHYIKNEIEMESKLLNMDTYVKWEKNIIDNNKKLHELVSTYKSQGYKMFGYGAAAKGNTLLNYSNIELDYIIDDNPLKQNLFTPGTSIPVVSSDILETINYDDKVLFLPLAWNFFNEIVANIKKKRDNPDDVFLKYFI